MTEKKYQDFLTPVGRLVQGSPSRGYSKDGNGNEKLYKSGEKKGDVRTDYFMAIALEKANPETQGFVDFVKATAREHVPSQVDEAGFAFKIVDGDSTTPNSKGKKPCDREGFPGHFVLSMSNDRIPTCYSAASGMAIKAEEIKTGFYVRATGSISGHGGQNPGLYINHQSLELVGYGDLINARPDDSEKFKSQQSTYTPAGMKNTPPAPGSKQSSGVPASPEKKPVPKPAPAKPQKTEYVLDGEKYTKEELIEGGWEAGDIAKLEVAF